MRFFNNPLKISWGEISARPQAKLDVAIEVVPSILAKVKNYGDKALREYSKEFDKVSLGALEVSEQEIESSKNKISEKLKESIRFAIQNVKTFHTSQLTVPNPPIQTRAGVVCWTESIPIESIGLYIPGGSAPLFSTVYMLGIPAIIAGVTSVSICTPPDKNGEINPAILFTAAEIGINKIYKVGGAQAIAAMAYGTESINKVDKIFGPGNQFVAVAKELISREGVDIDFNAGPSEVLVIADYSSNPAWVAADLIAQAEHGEDSQVVLASDSEEIIKNCITELERQTKNQSRESIIKKCLENSAAVLLKNIEECIEFSNYYAPEHLILNVFNPRNWVCQIKNAGSVFVGAYSPEVAGDYVSGTNHCLPTGGSAKNRGGVKVSDFKKEISFQEISQTGLNLLTPHIQTLAAAEGLSAHAYASLIRGDI